MKIIWNDHIPLKGFKAINLFGVIFVRRGKIMRDADLRHELIHTCQMREMLYVGFYLWYVAEWLVRLVLCRFDAHKAYRTISFEQEAYDCQRIELYERYRNAYAWTKYLTR